MGEGEFYVEVRGSARLKSEIEPIIDRALRAAGYRQSSPLRVVGADERAPVRRQRSATARKRTPWKD